MNTTETVIHRPIELDQITEVESSLGQQKFEAVSGENLKKGSWLFCPGGSSLFQVIGFALAHVQVYRWSNGKRISDSIWLKKKDIIEDMVVVVYA